MRRRVSMSRSGVARAPCIEQGEISQQQQKREDVPRRGTEPAAFRCCYASSAIEIHAISEKSGSVSCAVIVPV